MIKNIFTKQNLKRVGIVILGLLALFFIIILAGDKYYKYSQEKAQKKLVEEMNRPYLEDTYGGKTPEETFAMFLDALKKGDIELASKYFVIGNFQEENKKYLKILEEKNNLSQSIQQWEDALISGTKFEGEKNDYSITYKVRIIKPTKLINYKTNQESILPIGEYTNSIIFMKYPSSNIWKIADL
ncbi:MAG: hypothetical protein HYV52_02775 [Parcubacteria group bacterium]|nr:hypothetical protein [Parcubacteria group bacterium]